MATKHPSPDAEVLTDTTLPVPFDIESLPEPDPVVPRPYLEIHPAEVPIDPSAATHAMRMVDAKLRSLTRAGIVRKLRGTTVLPMVEWLLVSDGRPDPTIRYLVRSNHPELTEDLERILRTAFPNGYELRWTNWHPAYVQEFLPSDPHTDADHPAITPRSPYVAGVEFMGRVGRKKDWQTPLQPFTAFVREPSSAGGAIPTGTRRIPLAGLVETLHGAGCPVVYQVVVSAQRDWTMYADLHTADLERGIIGLGGLTWDRLFPRDNEELARYEPPPADRNRIEAISNRDPKHTFLISARAAVLTRDRPEQADAIARELATTLSVLGGRHHEVVGRVRTDNGRRGRGSSRGTAVYESILDGTVHPRTYSRITKGLPGRPRLSRGLVVAPDELPGFCLLDAAGLAPNGRRAVAARPVERTGLPLPPPALLARFSPPGMALGMPLTHDQYPYGRPLVLPPADQDRHVIVIGPTGSGKSILTETAMLTNVVATRGPAILLDFKGGGTAQEYLQTHYRTFGTLDDVTYFDCTRTLPALSVLDIGPLLEAGVPREEARSRIAGQYEEMLETLMGEERFWQAVEAPKAIRNHLRALFDPVHGSETVAHVELFDALRRTLGDDAPPAVADDRLTDYFASLLDRDRDVFNRVLGGALNRVETIATDGRLAPVFDHVPGESDPHFDFADLIDEDRVVIFDFGAMEDRAKRALTLAILSNLWRALQARTHGPDGDDDPPLVNCYLEEAGALAGSSILDTLLSQGRSFGLSMFLGVQFLDQLDSADPSTRTREEAINETATIIAGQVAVRDDLVDALASDVLPPDELNRRLSRMPRGEWLVRPGTAFGTESLRPFLMESLPAPPGHPASTEPLKRAERIGFDAAFETIQARSARKHGLELDDEIRVDPTPTAVVGEASEAVEPTLTVDHCYAHTKRMTSAVGYNAVADAVECLACGNRYDSDIHGMIRGIECHSSLEEVDRDDIPIGNLYLKLAPDERTERDLSDAQFRMLQAVYSAMQGRFHPLEYDLTRDSMIRLQEYVDIENDEVQQLVADGLLRKDTDHPYRLYSVTPTGRNAIGESYREGLDYGHGEGDLEESSQHVLGVILAERFLEAEYESDAHSPVERVQTYHDIGGNQRLDVAGLDANGAVVVAVEVERVNHDLRRAAPEDFDKMASCTPDEAIWVAMSHPDAHEILAALREPLDGEPRVTKTYARSTPAHDFIIDEPGFTKLYTLDQLRDRLGIG